MGNYISMTSHQFPCQICGNIFYREISGTLLCRECGINNEFEMIVDSNEKKSFVLSYVTFPSYMLVKNKPVMYYIVHDMKYNFHKEVMKEINTLVYDSTLGKRYRLIKSLLKYLDETNYIHENNLKGIYIQNMPHEYQEKEPWINVLFIHVSNVQDNDKILYVDLVGFVKKLIIYYEN